MGPESTGAVTLVRVTVTSATRRVDLALPGAVPLAELVPELVHSVGLRDHQIVSGGYHLVAQDGRVLVGDSGLSAQGVTDGAFLSVAVGAHDDTPPVYDDLADAMVDAVGDDLAIWGVTAGRRAALGVAVLLLLSAVGALLVRRGPGVGGEGAAVAAVLLVMAAVVASRRHRETEAPVAIALTGCVYAGVAGLLLGAGARPQGTSELFAGGGVLLLALLAVVGLAHGRTLLLPPIAVGGVLLSTGVVARASPCDPAVVLTVVLAVVVLAGSAFPGLALMATGTVADPLFTLADLTRDPERIELSDVRSDALLAHQIVVAMSATAGVLLLVVIPAAMSLGLAGTLVALLSCVLVLLRTRQHRSSPEVVIGLVSGLLGLVSTAWWAVWLHPGWQPGAALALATSGALVLVITPSERARSLRDGRLGDIVESAALLALSPTLVFATGLFSWVQSPGRAVTTKHELAQARAFERRRLVTAFQSGARSRCQAEQPRPWRAIAAGVVLGVMLPVGALVRGVVAGHHSGEQPHTQGLRTTTDEVAGP